MVTRTKVVRTRGVAKPRAAASVKGTPLKKGQELKRLKRRMAVATDILRGRGMVRY